MFGQCPTYNTRAFSYTPESKMFVSEASTLTLGKHLLDGQVYNDAADAGFNLVSERTGRTIRFYFSHDERDADGDVTVSIYKPDQRDAARFALDLGTTVHVLNT